MKGMEKDEEIEVFLADSSFSHFAKELAEMTLAESKNNRMLAWKEGELKKAMEDRDAFIAFFEGGLSGFVCLVPYQKYVEICALIVKIGRRSKHDGTRLMKEAIKLSEEKYPDKRIVLLANEISFRMGKCFGFVAIDKNDLDDEIRTGCASCPERKNYPDCHCQPMLLMQ